MAIKSEFSDGTGLDLFAGWSASADGFNTEAVRSTWRSIKAGGGVGIGTLLHLAKENGFVLPKPEDDQAPSKPDSEAAARLARERAASQQAEKVQQEASHALAATEAAALWELADEEGESAYLVRKGVQACGVRFGADGGLLVPLRDATGTLLNLQRIAPNKPAHGGSDKLFLKGGRKSGLWHWCGTPAGAAVLLVAEGYATGASVHQATGRPVAVAFDAGNLPKVAHALRKAYPAALLVLCGDDDLQTFATKGHNPGRDAATAAAQAVHGLAVFPEGLPDGGSDFNDMHQHLGGAAGLAAVRLVVDSAIDTFAPPHPAQTTKAGKGTPATRRKASGAASGQGAGGGDSDQANAFDPFTADDSGVWFRAVTRTASENPPSGFAVV
jgi:putative DNA primase/helicase